MNKEQKSALKGLERAFKKCHSVGLRFCGMDDTLYYATLDIINKHFKEWEKSHGRDGEYFGHGGEYCEVAYVQNKDHVGDDTGKVKAKAYTESGGW